MRREILTVGSPGLRIVASHVPNVGDATVVADAIALRDTLRAFRDEHGFGRAIAATQIGIARRMIGLALPDWPEVIVNPEIVWTSVCRITLWDDCMCFPDMLVRVERHASISLRFVDLAGRLHLRERLSPDVSELMQHEIDHLDGVLSFDRAVGANPFVHRRVFENEREAFARDVDHFTQPV
ncbi:peptide deformylase [Caballeronia ptereochthonis]|uniref:Peptide deformylase n=1 Tax=Caballeronia ptereochthonis TaxID=1777144 RepID=A0A157ZXR7_9BURK|nr:peptide deformylase [Caballeronia ptereochthonis]SAK50321.1 peptide deformylase [Caballeronia ptereochthonis]